MKLFAPTRIGYVTTYKQRCGIASYASHVLAQFAAKNITVLAETIELRQRTGFDEENVVRCWTKNVDESFTHLARVIEERNIEVLHLNCQHMFFNTAAFIPFLHRFRARGGKVILQMHSIGGIYPHVHQLAAAADIVVVHLEESRLELLANLVDEAKIRVIPLGILAPSARTKAEARTRLAIAQDAQVLFTPGFVRRHKGHRAIVESLPALVQLSNKIQYHVVGQPKGTNESELHEIQELRQLATKLNVEDHVHFISDFIPEDALLDFHRASDCIVLNYETRGFEASAVAAMAVGSGTPVVTSMAPQFNQYGNSVFRFQEFPDSHFGIVPTIFQALTNDAIRSRLLQEAELLRSKHSMAAIAKRFNELYSDLTYSENYATHALSRSSAVSSSPTVGI